jgi:hypothetical protein
MKDNVTLMLEASIALKRNEQEIKQLQTVVDILLPCADESLELFESLFNSDESFCEPVRMQWYITLAKYMYLRKGRKHIADKVEAKLKSLPFPEN